MPKPTRSATKAQEMKGRHVQAHKFFQTLKTPNQILTEENISYSFLNTLAYVDMTGSTFNPYNYKKKETLKNSSAIEISDNESDEHEVEVISDGKKNTQVETNSPSRKSVRKAIPRSPDTIRKSQRNLKSKVYNTPIEKVKSQSKWKNIIVLSESENGDSEISNSKSKQHSMKENITKEKANTTNNKKKPDKNSIDVDSMETDIQNEEEAQETEENPEQGEDAENAEEEDEVESEKEGNNPTSFHRESTPVKEVSVVEEIVMTVQRSPSQRTKQRPKKFTDLEQLSPSKKKKSPSKKKSKAMEDEVILVVYNEDEEEICENLENTENEWTAEILDQSINLTEEESENKEGNDQSKKLEKTSQNSKEDEVESQEQDTTDEASTEDKDTSEEAVISSQDSTEENSQSYDLNQKKRSHESDSKSESDSDEESSDKKKKKKKKTDNDSGNEDDDTQDKKDSDRDDGDGSANGGTSNNDSTTSNPDQHPDSSDNKKKDDSNDNNGSAPVNTTEDLINILTGKYDDNEQIKSPKKITDIDISDISDPFDISPPKKKQFRLSLKKTLKFRDKEKENINSNGEINEIDTLLSDKKKVSFSLSSTPNEYNCDICNMIFHEKCNYKFHLLQHEDKRTLSVRLYRAILPNKFDTSLYDINKYLQPKKKRILETDIDEVKSLVGKYCNEKYLEPFEEVLEGDVTLNRSSSNTSKNQSIDENDQNVTILSDIVISESLNKDDSDEESITDKDEVVSNIDGEIQNSNETNDINTEVEEISDKQVIQEKTNKSSSPNMNVEEVIATLVGDIDEKVVTSSSTLDENDTSHSKQQIEDKSSELEKTVEILDSEDEEEESDIHKELYSLDEFADSSEVVTDNDISKDETFEDVVDEEENKRESPADENSTDVVIDNCVSEEQISDGDTEPLEENSVDGVTDNCVSEEQISEGDAPLAPTDEEINKGKYSDDKPLDDNSVEVVSSEDDTLVESSDKETNERRSSLETVDEPFDDCPDKLTQTQNDNFVSEDDASSKDGIPTTKKRRTSLDTLEEPESKKLKLMSDEEQDDFQSCVDSHSPSRMQNETEINNGDDCDVPDLVVNESNEEKEKRLLSQSSISRSSLTSSDCEDDHMITITNLDKTLEHIVQELK